MRECVSESVEHVNTHTPVKNHSLPHSLTPSLPHSLTHHALLRAVQYRGSSAWHCDLCDDVLQPGEGSDAREEASESGLPECHSFW